MGLHGAREIRGSISLSSGWHDFKAYHFENGGGANMIVKYKGPDTNNKNELLEGNHDKFEKKEEEEQSNNGFIAKYWYFKKGTNGNGYKLDGIKPNLVKVTSEINFPND